MLPYSDKDAIGFCCEPLPDGSGNSWTLTTILGDLLADAEDKYGPRDKDWTILGIEFCGDQPQIWFPQFGASTRNIAITLSEGARHDPRQAVHELAHEVIHLLAPCVEENAPVIEEGLATLNSRQQSTLREIDIFPTDANYLRAEKLVEELLAICPDGIRRLRERHPNLWQVSPDQLQAACGGKLPQALAAELCRPFSEFAAIA